VNLLTYIIELCENCGEQFCDNIDCRGYKDEPEYLISFPENTRQKVITFCNGYEVAQEEVTNWESKKLYSKEEVYSILEQAIKDNNSKQLHFFDGGFSNPIYTNLKNWFKQFTKKI
jgi:predicted Fe-S protein YdhL (DUF1289 family)